MNKLKLAQNYYEDSVNILEKEFKGCDKILIADIKEKYAEELKKIKKIGKAKKYYRQALKIRTVTCNENGLDLASTYYSNERLGEYRRSTVSMQKLQSNDHASDEMAKIYVKIAEIYKFLNDCKKSLSYYNKTLHAYENSEKNYYKEIKEIRKEIDDIKEKLHDGNRYRIGNISVQLFKSRVQLGQVYNSPKITSLKSNN